MHRYLVGRRSAGVIMTHLSRNRSRVDLLHEAVHLLPAISRLPSEVRPAKVWGGSCSRCWRRTSASREGKGLGNAPLACKRAAVFHGLSVTGWNAGPAATPGG